MAKTGVRGFYLLTQAIKNQLLSDVNVNTVTEGDLFDVDLSKQSILLIYLSSQYSLCRI
jgi:hypothetical protein